MASVVNLYNIEPEWPPNYVYIGRAGHGFDGYLGNPFILKNEVDRDLILSKFEKWARARIILDLEYKERVKSLIDKVLVCFCAPKKCHGEVLAKLAEELNENNLSV